MALNFVALNHGYDGAQAAQTIATLILSLFLRPILGERNKISK
jgi:hypothetical protein